MTDVPNMREEVVEFCQKMAAANVGRPKPWHVTIEQSREGAREMFAGLNTEKQELAEVVDREVEGAFASAKVRLYRPDNAPATSPALVHAHGGGWIVGDLDSEDLKLRLLAKAAGIRIISIDYVLAPEHPFPEPVNDVVQIWCSILKRAREFGIDPSRTGLGGSSAGANLALAAALKLRDDHIDVPPAALCLFYGVYDLHLESPSLETFSVGYGLETEPMRYFRDVYCPDVELYDDPLASPGLARLEGLPAVFVNAAALDPLVDDSTNLACRLADASVPHELKLYDGVLHGFTTCAAIMECAVEGIDDAAAFLVKAL